MKDNLLSRLGMDSGSASFLAQMRRMEEAKRFWEQSMGPLTAKYERFQELFHESSASRVFKQLNEIDRQNRASMRAMLAPMEQIQKFVSETSSVGRAFEEARRRHRVAEEIARISEANSAARALQDSIAASSLRATEVFRSATIGLGIERLLKTYDDAHRLWRVPEDLLGTVGALRALESQFGRLTLPVIDETSAATLARMLGPEGIAAQLAKLGIPPVGEPKQEPPPALETGIGLSRRTLELMALLSFILAALVPIYQELSSRDWQDKTDTKLEAQEALLRAQAEQFAALSLLVQEAVVAEAQRRVQRFVVLERIATVRSKPEHGAAMTGKLLPREVVKLVAEHGKWIEIEYYHWLRQEYQTGWALKKYFTRVPLTFEGSRSGSASASAAEE